MYFVRLIRFCSSPHGVLVSISGCSPTTLDNSTLETQNFIERRWKLLVLINDSSYRSSALPHCNFLKSSSPVPSRFLLFHPISITWDNTFLKSYKSTKKQFTSFVTHKNKRWAFFLATRTFKFFSFGEYSSNMFRFSFETPCWKQHYYPQRIANKSVSGSLIAETEWEILFSDENRKELWPDNTFSGIK